MASTNTIETLDLVKIRAKVRWAYERARLKGAMLGVTPLALVAGLALCFASRPQSTLPFALGALVLGGSMLWYGREPKRAFLLGATAGIVPLVLATAANHIHVCGPSGCASWCVQACCTGGVMAGLLVAYAGHRRQVGARYWLCASGLALLVGAMGCSCIGVSGLLGLGLGFGAGVIPLALRRKSPR